MIFPSLELDKTVVLSIQSNFVQYLTSEKFAFIIPLVHALLLRLVEYGMAHPISSVHIKELYISSLSVPVFPLFVCTCSRCLELLDNDL